MMRQKDSGSSDFLRRNRRSLDFKDTSTPKQRKRDSMMPRDNDLRDLQE